MLSNTKAARRTIAMKNLFIIMLYETKSHIYFSYALLISFLYVAQYTGIRIASWIKKNESKMVT